MNDTQSRAVLSWITGNGNNEFLGDDSRGADIYRYVFAPRVSTKNNKSWYTPWWLDVKRRSGGLENITFFDYVENGGVMFYLSFYDIMGRTRYLGADNGYGRLSEILAWYKDTWNKGGYRKVYHAGDLGLQGCGKAGSLGIDCEFTETSMVPLVFLYGFLGVEAKIDGLHIDPKLPSDLSYAGVDNLFYQGKLYKITASRSVSQVSVSNVGGKSEIIIPLGTSYLLPFYSNNVSNAEVKFLTVPVKVNAGENFTVSVEAKNIGTTSWSKKDGYALGTQDPFDNLIWGTGRIFLEDNEVVSPNSSKVFTFNLKAPDTAGSQKLSLKMVQDKVEWFGEKATTDIKVEVAVLKQLNKGWNYVVAGGNGGEGCVESWKYNGWWNRAVSPKMSRYYKCGQVYAF